MTISKGDRFAWRGSGDDVSKLPVYVTVNRVARDQSWADIRVCNWACTWTKRIQLPLPDSFRPYRWDQHDLEHDFGVAMDSQAGAA